MNWSALIAVLLEFFGPLIRAWLENLFKQAEPKLGAAPGDTDAATIKLFAAAHAETNWWNFRKRAVLAACRRTALNRSASIGAAIHDGAAVPKLSQQEAKAIAAAM
jgi:hypothetical protein